MHAYNVIGYPILEFHIVAFPAVIHALKIGHVYCMHTKHGLTSNIRLLLFREDPSLCIGLFDIAEIATAIKCICTE